jgi:hypothetical protein
MLIGDHPGPVANVLAELIIGGSLASVGVTSETGGADAGTAA